MGWSLFRRTGLTYKQARFAGGYTLITPIGGDMTCLLDEQGRIAKVWKIPDFQPGYGYLLPGGNLLVRGQPLDQSGAGLATSGGRADILVELDWEGKEVWRWEHPAFHHDMCRLPNGNTLVIVWEQVPDALATRVQGFMEKRTAARLTEDTEHFRYLMKGLGVGGRPRDLSGFLADAVMEINRKGQAVHIWHAWEHLDPVTDIVCEREFRHEWSHANSVEYGPSGDVLISFRELSKLMRISWPEGKVLWEWGDGRISHQHDATFTSKNCMMVFDNGPHHPIVPRSRVIEVDMNTSNIIWQYYPEHVFSLFSGHVAGAERLWNGNTLICEGQSGRIFEVTPECDVCWEWISPFVLPFRGVKCSMLFRAHRYRADGPELMGRPVDAGRYEQLNRQWGLIGKQEV
jgi:hypothetical protein